MKKLFLLSLGCLLFLSNTSPANTYNPLMEELIFQVRDPQTKPKEFRELLEKIGQYLALDIAKDLPTKETKIRTLLDVEATHQLLDADIVVLTVLRAGIPFFNGILSAFPKASAGFFAMARDEETLKATLFYQGIPSLKGKHVILCDTMIATGGSIIDALKIIETYEPKQIIVAGVLLGEAGKEKILSHNPNVKIYAAYTDPIVNKKGYIVPGLGDAGDRCYGLKVK